MSKQKWGRNCFAACGIFDSTCFSQDYKTVIILQSIIFAPEIKEENSIGPNQVLKSSTKCSESKYQINNLWSKCIKVKTKAVFVWCSSKCSALSFPAPDWTENTIIKPEKPYRPFFTLCRNARDEKNPTTRQPIQFCTGLTLQSTSYPCEEPLLVLHSFFPHACLHLTMLTFFLNPEATNSSVWALLLKFNLSYFLPFNLLNLFTALFDRFP